MYGKTIPSRPILAMFTVIAATSAIYAQTYGHDFILLDDSGYVVSNPWVRMGLSARGFAWAFTTFFSGNWHPLTWLSLMTDVSLFGVNPGGHHLVNVLLHSANALLLFAVLSRMTRAPWQSVFVAAVFALHPLHVESVAWISERKDLLCAFFFLLTLLCYAWYVQCPGFRRYLPLAIMFILALLSKSMAVTLPFVLLLLDYWPLERCRTPSLRLARALVLEKLPLFMISVAFCVLTVAAQSQGNTVSLAVLPFWARIVNAVRSYGIYLLDSIWPTSLAVFYPHPGTAVDFQGTVAAALLLVLITVIVVRSERRQPWLITGWFWYLGMLVPVIGFFQTGGQAYADRYMYLPLIGLSIIAAWSFPELVERKFSKGRLTLQASAVLLLTLLGAATWRQAGYWRDSISLFSRTIEVTSRNVSIQSVLGRVLVHQGRIDEGVVQLNEVLRSRPDFGNAHLYLAEAFLNRGLLGDAEREFREASRLLPWDPGGRLGVGLVRLRQNRVKEALSCFQEALAVDPGNSDALYYIGQIREKGGDLGELTGTGKP